MVTKTVRNNIGRALRFVQGKLDHTNTAFISITEFSLEMWGKNQIQNQKSLEGYNNIGSHFLNYMQKFGLISSNDFRYDKNIGGRHFYLTQKGIRYLEEIDRVQ